MVLVPVFVGSVDENRLDFLSGDVFGWEMVGRSVGNRNVFNQLTGQIIRLALQSAPQLPRSAFVRCFAAVSRGRLAQLARALGRHPRGHRFKSCIAHFFNPLSIHDLHFLPRQEMA